MEEQTAKGRDIGCGVLVYDTDSEGNHCDHDTYEILNMSGSTAIAKCKACGLRVVMRGDFVQPL